MSYLLSTLRSCGPERHKKAIAGLFDGSFAITIAYRSEDEIRAIVKNGDGAEYGVLLSDRGNFCSCKDALYRHGVVCKHQIAAAVWFLQQAETPANPIHLWFPDGTAALCGETHPKRFWQRWNYNVFSWPDVCPSCVHQWADGRKTAPTRDQLAA